LACKVAESKDIEDKATEKVCNLIALKFKPIPDCTKLLDAAWDKVAAVCPKGYQSLQLSHFPHGMKHKIERLACRVAEEKDIEDKATEKVCNLIALKFKPIPDCIKLLDAAWDKVAAMCPKGYQSLQLFPHGMIHKIERLACQVSERKDIEDKATEKVCNAIADKFKPIPDCTKLLDAAWDEVAAKCPKGQDTGSSILV
jgi:hypothetical protein